MQSLQLKKLQTMKIKTLVITLLPLEGQSWTIRTDTVYVDSASPENVGRSDTGKNDY